MSDTRNAAYKAFCALNAAAWVQGNAEKNIDGLGLVRIHALRLASGKPHSRIYFVNGARVTGRSLAERAMAVPA